MFIVIRETDNVSIINMDNIVRIEVRDTKIIGYGINTSVYTLGTYETKEEAVEAINILARKLN